MKKRLLALVLAASGISGSVTAVDSCPRDLDPRVGEDRPAALDESDIRALAPDSLQTHHVFKGALPAGNGQVQVPGYPVFTYTDASGVRREGLNYRVTDLPLVGTLDERVFNFERRVARGVLRAELERPYLRNGVMEGQIRGSGSAVVVGRNLVLTNRHVLRVMDDNTVPTECPGGKLTTGDDSRLETSCKKILQCGVLDAPTGNPNELYSNFGDWCLIETTPLPDGSEIGDHVEPIPMMKSIHEDLGQKVATLGNAAGLGIQASWGKITRVARLRANDVSTRGIDSSAYSVKGVSGGALVTPEGGLFGIVWGGDGVKLSLSNSIRTDYIYGELSKTMSPEIMSRISTTERVIRAERRTESCTQIAQFRLAPKKSRRNWLERAFRMNYSKDRETTHSSDGR